MQQEQLQNADKRINKTILAFKAARIALGLSRKEAAVKCSCSIRAFEQLENGRCNFTESRIRRLIESMGMSWPEFKNLEKSPEKALAQIDAYNQERTLARKPRRNLYKIITKEVRIIRILRKRKGISQYKASSLCGYRRCTFGLFEAGRTDLTPERIEHILRCLGYRWVDFEKLMKAPLLADEIIADIVEHLDRLDEQALLSAANIIKALAK